MVEHGTENNQNRLKKWIVLLLAVSCFASVLLYFSYSPFGNTEIRNSEQVDSLIARTLSRFNVTEKQIRKRSVVIDSIPVREVYTVDVPPGFSKTQWHYELDKQVQPYGMRTPSKVQFPEKDIQIHLTHGTNIIRSVVLRTDPELVLYRDFAALIIAFDQSPNPSDLNDIIALGEPIHLALRSGSPGQNYNTLQELRRRYPRTIWLLQEDDGTNFNHPESINPYLSHASRIHQIDPGALILFFNPFTETPPDPVVNRMNQLDLAFIDAGDAMYIEDLSDADQVQQITEELLIKSSITNPPILMIEGSDSNIQRLQAFITTLKENNIQLRTPSTDGF